MYLLYALARRLYHHDRSVRQSHPRAFQGKHSPHRSRVCACKDSSSVGAVRRANSSLGQRFSQRTNNHVANPLAREGSRGDGCWRHAIQDRPSRCVDFTNINNALIIRNFWVKQRLQRITHGSCRRVKRYVYVSGHLLCGACEVEPNVIVLISTRSFSGMSSVPIPSSSITSSNE